MKTMPHSARSVLSRSCNVIERACFAGLLCLGLSARLHAAGTLWNFDNTGDPLAATSGPGTMTYYDPDGTFWGFDGTTFGTASSLGLPAMMGGGTADLRMHQNTLGAAFGWRF